ncbi:hypothetical protein QOZ80_2AG0142960 [Eleusine coracana subsp. coracana]|nr:hypothetical protein QOZ80_2AG0142960 [Eleusine coracana subsp. coracana]
MGAVEAAMRKSGTQEFMFMPTVGATFPSLGDAYQLYNLYSWEAGFSIRMFGNKNKANEVNSDGDKVKNMQEFSCQRAGKPRKNVKSTTMCGCPARLRLLRNKNNEWYIKTFVAEHNHELVKGCGEKRHLTSHQSLDQSTKDLVRYLWENNVGLSKVNNICGSMVGSVNNLTFNKNHLKSYCSKIAEDLIADDMQKTINGFIKMREEDPNFVYAFQMDRHCRITALMWSSGNSRKMYSHFGDAVTFDTTFNSNIYKMPFGMFVGVNNHFQSTIFAGVLLTSEDIPSFKWAFKTFVEMMGNKPPATILTDQCAAMAAAIREVLPKAAHRWCKWHVLKKVVETLGHLFTPNSEFSNDFNKLVNHMWSQQEFEDGWGEMLKKYNLVGQPELIRAFESRELWAMAWFAEIFCARMTSTQRSESANHVLKNLVPATAPLNLFAKQYTGLVLEQEKAYHASEKKTKQTEINPRFRWPIKAHAAKVYTHAVYELFAEELLKSTSYVVLSNMDDGPNVYHVSHVESDRRKKWAKVHLKVQVMVQRGLKCIPDVHVMQRWTRNACIDNPSHLIPNEESQSALDSPYFRNNLLEVTVREVLKVANTERECFNLAMKELPTLLKKMNILKDSIRTECHVRYESTASGMDCSRGRASRGQYYSDNEGQPLLIVDSSTGATIDINSIKPPIVKRSMGRPTNARFKSKKDVRIHKKKIQKQRSRKQAKDGGVKQTKHFRVCRDPHHNSSNCPVFHQTPQTD